MARQPPWLAKSKPGNAAEDAKDGGMDDAQETPVGPKKKIIAKVQVPMKQVKAGSLPPGLQAAIGRKLGQGN